MTPLLHTSSKHISERYTNTKTRLGITQQTPRQRKSSTLNKALFQSLGFGVYEHHRALKCVKIKHHLGATNKHFDTKSISLQKMRWFHTTSEPINHPENKSIPCLAKRNGVPPGDGSKTKIDNAQAKNQGNPVSR